MEDVFLLLGSNLGDRSLNLESAIAALNAEFRITARSKVYRTGAWGLQDQPDFYNQVIRGKTTKDPGELLDFILLVEREMGRERKEKWGARTIDIDILFFGRVILDTPRLVVPHPQIPNRRFTLIPLAEIAPDFVHPALGKTISELLRECPDPLGVSPLESEA